jgi:hypothetical protein
MTLDVNNTLNLSNISKDVRFNKYSCQANESIASTKSEDIQINVMCKYNSVKNFKFKQQNQMMIHVNIDSAYFEQIVIVCLLFVVFSSNHNIINSS